MSLALFPRFQWAERGILQTIIELPHQSLHMPVILADQHALASDIGTYLAG